MREIIISTESGSDLPHSLIEQFSVYVAPMHVIMNDVSYDDGAFPIDNIYTYFEQTKKVPTTSAVNVNEYDELFQKIRTEHPDCVIYHLAYSSKASSTYQNAKIAIEHFDDIYLIDTKSVSGGCTAHISNVYQRIQEKKEHVTDYEAFATELQAMADKVICHFIPGTLEYLKAGGRVSNAAYLGATLLQLKPLIIIEDGQLIAAKKFRGSISKILRKFMEDFVNRYQLKKDCLYLMYSKGLAEDTLKQMREIALEMGFLHTEYVMTGCTITCHGGQGAVGLAGTKL